jgi:hypothetical protein
MDKKMNIKDIMGCTPKEYRMKGKE